MTPAEIAAFGKPDMAEQKLQNILQKQHDNLEARIELIRLYLYRGEFERAKEEAARAKTQWPGEKRFGGLLKCAIRGNTKHKAKARQAPVEDLSRVFTCEKTFSLFKFVFCIVASAVAFSIFYYYMYYLDSGNSSTSGLAKISRMPLNILLLQLAFYAVLLYVLWKGLLNLMKFLFEPELVAVSDSGLMLKSKMLREMLKWEQIRSVQLVEQSQYHKKENMTTYDQWLEVQADREPGVFSPRSFLHRIPRVGLTRFDHLVDLLKDYCPVSAITRNDMAE